MHLVQAEAQDRSAHGIGPGELLSAAACLKKAPAVKEAEKRSACNPAAEAQPAGKARP